MKRLLFIYNPQAGKGLIKPHLANVVDAFTKAGYLVTVWPTQGKADAARVAARQGWWYDRVVCCGGDGTLSETVSGLLTLDAPPVLGYIPTGTTNDFAKNLGLPRGVEKAAATAMEGTPRPCDMGRFNDRTFVYVAAFGIFTDVSYDTPQQFKSAFGHLAYVLEGATKLGDLGRGYHLTVEHDGGTLEGDFIYGMVTNTNSVGGFKVFPSDQVSLDDGVFEVVLVGRPGEPGPPEPRGEPPGGGLPHQQAEGGRRRGPALDSGRGVRRQSGGGQDREPPQGHHPGLGKVKTPNTEKGAQRHGIHHPSHPAGGHGGLQRPAADARRL